MYRSQLSHSLTSPSAITQTLRSAFKEVMQWLSTKELAGPATYAPLLSLLSAIATSPHAAPAVSTKALEMSFSLYSTLPPHAQTTMALPARLLSDSGCAEGCFLLPKMSTVYRHTSICIDVILAIKIAFTPIPDLSLTISIIPFVSYRRLRCDCG